MAESTRHTLVVGGTRGIGRALVSLLSSRGEYVSVIGRRIPTADTALAPNVRYYVTDLLDSERTHEALTEISSGEPSLSAVVILQRYRDAGDNWEGEWRTSLTATRQIVVYVADKFALHSSKSIVLVTSIATHYIAAEQPISYHVGKAGLLQMARYYAVALGKHGIRVNCVSPAIVMKEEARAFYAQNPHPSTLFDRISPLTKIVPSNNE